MRREREEGLGTLDARRLTVGQYLTRWIEGPLNTSVAPKTRYDYSYLARRYLIPEDRLGRLKLRDLNAEHLDDLYADLIDEGLSPRMVGYVHTVARGGLGPRGEEAPRTL